MTSEETFSTRLKCGRKKKGLSQKDLALLMGVHIGTVSHWENGKQIPNSNMIQKLAATLEINTSYLLGEDKTLLPIDIKSKEPEIDELVEKLKVLSSDSSVKSFIPSPLPFALFLWYNTIEKCGRYVRCSGRMMRSSSA